MARKKPLGGFRFISVAGIASAWWAYLQGLIRIADLRAWFACQEADARRCGLKEGEVPRFNLEEIRGLTGVPVSKLRGSVTRLEGAGLLRWSETVLSFGEGNADRPGFAEFFARLPNNSRLVPVPRKIVRLIAGGARPALIACILGHLLRCLYRKKGLLEPLGRCKASWIAETFGVSLRRVKDARAELFRLGWLVSADAPQWALNRWGAWVSINLDWERLDGTSEARNAPKTTPPPADFRPETAPPVSDKEPLQESNNQKPASGEPAGVSSSEGKGAEKPPTLRDVVPSDLGDVGRLLTLFAEAMKQGLVTNSEADRIRFVAAADHARVIGTKNPCGLFVRLVRGKLWHYLNHDDEDAARRRLDKHLFGSHRCEKTQSSRALNHAPSPAPELSDDARMVNKIRLAALRANYRGDAFYLLRRESPDWTRDRWDAACREISGEKSPAVQSKESNLIKVGSLMERLTGELASKFAASSELV